MSVSDFDSADTSRVQSPRPETPEPGSRQGRRNAEAGVQLLDDDGAISDKLEQCLQHIFAKYCTPQPSSSLSPTAKRNSTLLVPPPDACLTPAGLDKWAQDTNGAPFTDEAKEELKEFLDVDKDGNLTFNGFLQIYQLQTETDDEETWRDLSSHGFDRSLILVPTRREELDLDESIATRSSERSAYPTSATVESMNS